MEQTKRMEAHVLTRRIYNKLGEVMDLSRQLAEALDRNDEVSVRVLLNMREEPLREAQQTHMALQQIINETADGERLRALLNGAAAQSEGEEPLAAQIGMNRRLLDQVQELDRALNRKLTRERSIYDNK